MEGLLAPLPMVYIFHSFYVSREFVLMLMTSKTETNLTVKILKQDYRHHKIRKTFSKFYHRYSESWSLLLNAVLVKALLQQGISRPVSYGDLFFKFKRIVGILAINSKI